MPTATATKISSKPLTRREREIASLYKRMLNAEARASTQYDLRDRLALKLAEELGGDGKKMRTSTDGRGIQVIDNYRAAIRKAESGEMPKCWGHGSVRQYEFKEIAAVSE